MYTSIKTLQSIKTVLFIVRLLFQDFCLAPIGLWPLPQGLPVNQCKFMQNRLIAISSSYTQVGHN